jgi:hypothetical protein
MAESYPLGTKSSTLGQTFKICENRPGAKLKHKQSRFVKFGQDQNLNKNIQDL